MKRLFKFLFELSVLFAPGIVFADEPKGVSTFDPATSATGLQDLFGTDLMTPVERFLIYILQFAAIGAVLFIVYGGYQYMVSGANEEMAEKGKRTVRNATIGLIIILLSMTIAGFVIRYLGNVNGP